MGRRSRSKKAWVGARWAAGRAGPGVGDGARPGVGRLGQRPVPHPGPDAHPVPDVDAHPGGDPDGDAGRFAHADAFSSTDVHARAFAHAFAHAASSNGNAHSLANGFSYAHRHGGSSPPTSATRPIGGIKWGSGHPGFGYRSVAADRRGALGASGRGRSGRAGGPARMAPTAISSESREHTMRLNPEGGRKAYPGNWKRHIISVQPGWPQGPDVALKEGP